MKRILRTYDKMADEMTIKVVGEIRIKHFHTCCSYQKTMMKVMKAFPLPLELDKYIFTYVGLSRFYVPDYKVDALVALRLKELSP